MIQFYFHFITVSPILPLADLSLRICRFSHLPRSARNRLGPRSPMLQLHRHRKNHCISVSMKMKHRLDGNKIFLNVQFPAFHQASSDRSASLWPFNEHRCGIVLLRSFLMVSVTLGKQRFMRLVADDEGVMYTNIRMLLKMTEALMVAVAEPMPLLLGIADKSFIKATD